MKKLILSMAVILLTVFSVNAQSYTLAWEGETYGDTVTLEGTPDSMLKFYGLLTNNSSDSDTIKIRRRLIDLSSVASHYFCWGLCYPPNLDSIVEPAGFVVLEPGQTSAELDFNGYYTPNGFVGTSLVEYTFFNKNDVHEYLTVVARYVTSPDGINENILKNISMSDIYPNPATNHIIIDYKLPGAIDVASVKIVSLLGSVVKEQNLSVENTSMRMDISGLNSGIYFYSLIVNGYIYSTKKLVVK